MIRIRAAWSRMGRGRRAETGHDVDLAATGRAGLRAAQARRHDLVVLDLVLPDVSGEHVLHELLRVDELRPVLVLSSVHEVGRRVGVLDSGAADFLAKPFANAELLARIRGRLRNP